MEDDKKKKESLAKKIVKSSGYTEKIDTREVQPILSPREHKLKITKDRAAKMLKKGDREGATKLLKEAMASQDYKITETKKKAAKSMLSSGIKSNLLKKVGSKALKSIPIIGGIASAISSNDASAAIPVLGDSESTGPAKGSRDAKFENPNTSDKDREQMYKESIKNALKKKKMSKGGIVPKC